jgi:hypothetical protein
MKPTISFNPNPSLAVIEVDKGIRKFWKHHGGRFAAVWRGMTKKARERLLFTVGPEMARTRNEPESYGQLLLIPEFVVSELANQGDALIQVIERAVDKSIPRLIPLTTLRVPLTPNNNVYVCDNDL